MPVIAAGVVPPITALLIVPPEIAGEVTVTEPVPPIVSVLPAKARTDPFCSKITSTELVPSPI